MGTYIVVGNTSQLKDGTMTKVTVEGRDILLARVGDKYYAVDNRCPHMGGDLSTGKLEGTIVTCPRHGSQFDLVDGRVVRWMTGTGLAFQMGKIFKPPRKLTTYGVKLEGDKVLIEF